jgi:Transglycosylase SLT domain
MRSLAGPALALAVSVLLLSDVGLTGHASAAEGEENGAAQASQQPPQPVSTDTICSALAAAAAQNDLPTDFFARLIWQESRFDPAAVSRAGAQGVAQFMPATANWRGLSNPFEPLEAISQSAWLLRDLRREFGNLGLAAAAYNAGSGRVHDWMAGRRALPAETNAYVRIVTGYAPEQWTGAHAGIGEMKPKMSVPCRDIAALIARMPPPASKPTPVWALSSWEARPTRRLLPPIAGWSRSTHPCWAAGRPMSFTMAWDAAPWDGLTCASGLTTAPAPRNYVPSCAGPA